MVETVRRASGWKRRDGEEVVLRRSRTGEGRESSSDGTALDEKPLDHLFERGQALLVSNSIVLFPLDPLAFFLPFRLPRQSLVFSPRPFLLLSLEFGNTRA